MDNLNYPMDSCCVITGRGGRGVPLVNLDTNRKDRLFGISSFRNN